MELTVRNVTKKYNGKIAVSHVDLSLTNGVWGLLGANGAGKTTLIRMIAGILTPTEGQVLCNGVDIHALGEKYRDDFGYLPQSFGFYPEFTVQDYLRYVAALKNLDRSKADRRIDYLLALVSLEDVKKKPIRKLSGGMQRRVGIAQALLNDPKILVLDEPTSGLDPGERVRFRNIISELGQDRIVLISTHIVSDVEYIATQNGLMKDGQIIAINTTDELTKMADGIVWQATIATSALGEVEKSVCVVNIKNEEDGQVAVRYLAKEPMLAKSIPAQPRLEDLYLWLFRKEIEPVGRKTRE